MDLPSSAGILAVAYHNLAAECEHLGFFSRAMDGFRRAALLARCYYGRGHESHLRFQGALAAFKVCAACMYLRTHVRVGPTFFSPPLRSASWSGGCRRRRTMPWRTLPRSRRRIRRRREAPSSGRGVWQPREVR